MAIAEDENQWSACSHVHRISVKDVGVTYGLQVVLVITNVSLTTLPVFGHDLISSVISVVLSKNGVQVWDRIHTCIDRWWSQSLATSSYGSWDHGHTLASFRE